MNRLAIFWNNHAVSAMKMGKPYRAFEMLSDASDVVFQRLEQQERQSQRLHQQQASNNNHDSKIGKQQQQDTLPKHYRRDISSPRVFTYTWQHCNNAINGDLPDQIKSKRGSGNSQLLCLSLFNVNVACNESELEEYDIVEFSWVIWYNLATLCSFFGTLLSSRGVKLSQRANVLYQTVQQRLPQAMIRNFPPLQLALWNNHACTLCDLNEMQACRATALKLSQAVSVLGRQRREQARLRQLLSTLFLDSFQLSSFILSQKHSVATAA